MMKKAKWFICIIISYLTTQVSAQSTDYLSGEIYLKLTSEYYSGHHQGQQVNIAFELPQELIEKYQIDSIWRPFSGSDALKSIYRIRFNLKDDVTSLMEEIEAIGSIEYAEQIPLIQTDAYVPDDNNSNQWYLGKITTSWDTVGIKKEVKIAVVDNAIRITHEDLAPNIWINTDEIPDNGIDDDLNGFVDDVKGFDVADQDNDPSPPSSVTDYFFSHGTHAAGIVSASTDNSKGVASISMKSKIIPIKAALDYSSNGSDRDLPYAYEGVNYAMRIGADVINMSWGTSIKTQVGEAVIKAALDKGIVLVAAAGNKATHVPTYPAAYDGVIAVGATDEHDRIASFSNYGSYIDVMAPGTNIYSTLAGSDQSYGPKSGTSMACPIVASFAALVLSVKPTLAPAKVEELIEVGCINIDQLNAPRYGHKMGAGRINVDATLQQITVVGIHDVDVGENAVTLFPNPSHASDMVSIKVDYRTTGQVEQLDVVDYSGKIIKSFDYSSNPFIFDSEVAPLTLQNLSKGVYLVRLKTANYSLINKKLIVLQ